MSRSRLRLGQLGSASGPHALELGRGLRPSADLEVSRCATWPHQGTPWRPSRRHVESNVVRTGVAAGISEWSSTASSATGGAAVFPEEVIAAHQHFIERRRTTRPFGELRTASVEEWAEFENHFQLRKVPLGDCHRPYGTPCVHEHACTRCRFLRVDPAQLPRIEDMTRNAQERLTEARDRAWLGEVAALEESLEHLRQRRDEAENQLQAVTDRQPRP
jgi:hypothetical protein